MTNKRKYWIAYSFIGIIGFVLLAQAIQYHFAWSFGLIDMPYCIQCFNDYFWWRIIVAFLCFAIIFLIDWYRKEQSKETEEA